MKHYHPHGDASIYDTMVRLAQPWVMRYPLIDGQGNFGSMDGDPPAAHRYTEARMAPIAMQIVEDIDKDTVDFVDNYSSTTTEPSVLPALLPNLLVNGSSGIAVGMATNIPPHNLTEVCDGLTHLIDNPEATTEELTRIIRGPDFPTGGIIYGRDIATVYGTGHGRIVMRAQVEFEESRSGREQIIVRELPYQVNKARLIANIAELVNDKKIDGISDLRDESGRKEAVRIVIELKSNARPHTVLNNLYKHTQLQTDLRGDHARAGRRPAPGTGDQGAAPGVHRLPARRGHPAHPLPAEACQGAGPHPRRADEMPRPPRRGDQDHPRRRRREDRAHHARATLRAHRAAVEGDHRPPPRTALPPRGRPAPPGVRGADQGDQPARGHPRRRPQGRHHPQGRAHRAAQEVRRRRGAPRSVSARSSSPRRT